MKADTAHAIHERRQQVHTEMLKGEYNTYTIRRNVNNTLSTNYTTGSIKADIDSIRNESKQWADGIINGDSLVMAKVYDDMLLRDIGIMQGAIEALATEPVDKAAHKLAWLYPQLEAAIKFQSEMREKYPMMIRTQELHERLLAKQQEQANGKQEAKQHV